MGLANIFLPNYQAGIKNWEMAMPLHETHELIRATGETFELARTILCSYTEGGPESWCSRRRLVDPEGRFRCWSLLILILATSGKKITLPVRVFPALTGVEACMR